ncbi:hypothetical protein [uncultured Draconibacterium sp.]|uniref:hypothetical protein n=1 Tax=uncultured Draconibacterium sp. TaxID=1573823 RepID=UPI0029C8D02B|nr:hypothetical protein [uncultured Draconibacterium sp.]
MTSNSIEKLSLYGYQQTPDISAIKEYAENRRDRWMDYSMFCCSQVGLSNYAPLLLDNVITKAFSRDEMDLGKLYITKRGQYTLLDFVVHDMIRVETKTITDPTKYIQERYPRWLDFSEYHCRKWNMEDETIDVLNEVLYSVLKRDESWLFRMCNTDSKCGRYKELDLYVLMSIRLNITSPTSPYRFNYKTRQDKIGIDSDVNFSRLEVEDEPMDSSDDPAEQLKQYRLVMYVFKALDLTEFEYKVFEHRFVMCESMSDWSGSEQKKHLYEVYGIVKMAIKEVVYRKGWMKEEPIYPKHYARKHKRRVMELVDNFFQNRIIHIQSKNDKY